MNNSSLVDLLKFGKKSLLRFCILYLQFDLEESKRKNEDPNIKNFHIEIEITKSLLFRLYSILDFSEFLDKILSLIKSSKKLHFSELISYDDFYIIMNKREKKQFEILKNKFNFNEKTIFESVLQNKNVNDWEEEMIDKRFSIISNQIKEKLNESDWEKRIVQYLENLKTIENKREKINFINLIENLEALILKIEDFECTAVPIIILNILQLIENPYLIKNIREIILQNSKTKTYDILFFPINNKIKLTDEKNINKNAILTSLKKLLIYLSNEKFTNTKDFCLIFISKIDQLEDFIGLDMIIDLIIRSKIYKKNELLVRIYQKELFSWKDDLEKEILSMQVKENINSKNLKEIDETVDLLHSIKIKHDDEIVRIILEKMRCIDFHVRDHEVFNSVLYKIFNIAQNVSKSDLFELEKKFDDPLYLSNGFSEELKEKELSINEIFEEMQKNNKIKADGVNESIKEILHDKKIQLIKIIDNSLFLDKLPILFASSNNLNISCWQKEHITEWANQFKKNEKLRNLEKLNLSNNLFDENLIIELLSIISRAIEIFDG